jgi:hypothetical protein
MPIPDPARPADLVLLDGDIVTMDAARRTAQALAVRDGRIAAVGWTSDVRRHVGRRTRVVELRGRTVVPGFGDAHVHPISSGLERRRCDLLPAADGAGCLELVRAHADAHPKLEWILGGGWSWGAFGEGGALPTRSMLDAVVPDRPVFLYNRDGHGAWANSRALEQVGIRAETPDPPDGRIEREPDGSPQGTLHEGATELVERVAPPATAAELEAALADAQAYLHSLGITAWQDAHVHPDELEAYLALAGRGELTARVVAALHWDGDGGLEQLERVEAQRARGPVGRFRATSVKLFLDGVVETFTAGMLEPFLGPDGRPTTNVGQTLIPPAKLAEIVAALDGRGFQAHFHALGDRAVRSALDAVEAARAANGPSDARHHLSHIQVVDPADLGRFRRLGAVATMQPLWACLETAQTELTMPFLGPERSARQYPFRSLVEAGATLAGGSDWSVSSPDPLLEIEVAVERVDPERRGSEPFFPAERIDLATALAAFTIGSAFVDHREDRTGSLEPGKVADLAVLDRPLFDRAAGPIGDARVVATLVEGVPVFEAPVLDG